VNFLEFKNFNEFKTKMDMDGKEAVMFLLDEIEKKERRINNHLSGPKKSKTEDDTF